MNVPEGVPSSVDTVNTTPRTYTPNTYVKGLAFNNYYNQASSVTTLNVTASSIQLVARSGYGVGFPFLSTGNKNYVLSFDTNGTDNRGCSILYYKEDGTLINFAQSTMAGNHVTKSFTTPSDTYYLVIEFYGSSTSTNIEITNVQLEEGNVATAYEPYYVTSTTTVVQNDNHTLTAIWQKN